MKIDHRASLLEDSAISMSIPFIPRLREERREGLGGDTFASGPNRAGDLHHVVSVFHSSKVRRLWWRRDRNLSIQRAPSLHVRSKVGAINSYLPRGKEGRE